MQAQEMLQILTLSMVNTDTTEFEMIGDILIARHSSGMAITEEIARGMVKSRKEYMKNKSCKVIIVFPKLSSMDKAGRDYLSSPDAKEGITASAMVTTSILSRVIINFFLKLNNNDKGDVPNAVFSSEEDALIWLKELK